MSDTDKTAAPAAKAFGDDICRCPMCSSPFSTGTHRGPAARPADPPVGAPADLAAQQDGVLRAGRAS